MNHEAIYNLYPNVVSVDGTTAYDANGNQVTIDEALVAAWVDPMQYAKDRAKEYPPLEEQMDMQYWDLVNGTTVWADTIAAIKAKYPKPE